MWIFEPSKFASKSEAWLLDEGYMDSHKAQIERALANASSIPTELTLSSAVDCVAEEAGIRLSTDQLCNILSLYPVQRGKLATCVCEDTELRELILDVVANFMANTRWPQGADNVDMQTFIGRLKAAASFLGYSTTGKARCC